MNTKANFSCRSGRSAFTLTELLIVIGIVALLIAILLPALNQARRTSMTLKCASNQRRILSAMSMYANDYDYAIPGSPSTSGVRLLTTPPGYTNANCPERISIFDYKTPLARYLDIEFNSGPALADRIQRMQFLNESDPFLCPQNAGVLATAFTDAFAPPGPVSQWNSYSTASLFMYQPAGSRVSNMTTGLSTFQRVVPHNDYKLPLGYFPRLTRIGSASSKVFLADGARYAQLSDETYILTYSLNTVGSAGGDFSSYGPFNIFDNAFGRDEAPINQAAGQNRGGPDDTRLLWARHGRSAPRLAGDNYQVNVAFFDGRVERMGDLQASNPVYWAPAGSRITADAVWADTLAKFVQPGEVGVDGRFQVRD